MFEMPLFTERDGQFLGSGVPLGMPEAVFRAWQESLLGPLPLYLWLRREISAMTPGGRDRVMSLLYAFGQVAVGVSDASIFANFERQGEEGSLVPGYGRSFVTVFVADRLLTEMEGVGADDLLSRARGEVSIKSLLPAAKLLLDPDVFTLIEGCAAGERLTLEVRAKVGERYGVVSF